MSISKPITHTQTWHTVHQTQSLGRRLGEAATAGQVIALQGDLGAGKTTLTQGIAAGLGIMARVTSPTFILLNEYDAGSRGLRLVHIDTYRLGEDAAAAQSEAATFGLEEILVTAGEPDADSHGAVVVVEWAERVAPLLPADHLTIALTMAEDAPDERFAMLCAFGPQSAALLAQVTQ
jgi:tRNA threonylcarbamoyladenosine biosynthesis protein TsaE